MPMPYIDIHWKGRPHRRLPRIRLPSNRRTPTRSRSNSHAGPLGKRKKPLFRIRRKKSPSSHTSSIIRARKRESLRARKHASLRARQNVQAFGWDSELGGQVSTAKSASTIKPGRKSNTLVVPQNNITDSTVIEFDSTDGAASSAIRAVKRPQENTYSLKPVVEVPVYWTKPRQTPDEKKPSVTTNRTVSITKEGGEFCDCEPIGGTRTYDPKIVPESPTGVRSKSIAAQSKTIAPTRRPTAKSRVSTKENRQANFGDPAFWEAINSFALQVKESAAITPSVKSIVQSLSSDTASRTPSQRRAIKKFTQEISLYLQAARTHPKQSLVTSPSVTTISANTIAELKPFRSEFLTAGLAVTSTDQRGMPLRKSTRVPSPPPTPPKDEKWTKRQSAAKEGKAVHNARDHGGSTSTGTTVLGFTPPHEKSYPRPKGERIARRSSSEGTEIGFTPPHELYASPPRPKPRASQSPPKKKSLPWLQRPDRPVEEPLFVTGPSRELIERSKTREAEREAERKADPPPGVVRRSTEVRFNDMRYGNKKPSDAITSVQRNQRSEIATQTEPVRVVTAVPNDVVLYSNVATQTFQGNEQSQNTKIAAIEQEILPFRPQLTSGKSRTFPIASAPCTDHCVQGTHKTAVESSENKSPRRSRVFWKGVNHDTQTESVEPVAPKEIEPPAHRKRSSFKPIPKATERVQTFPLAAVSSGGPVVVQAPSPPARRQPSVPRCTQCPQCSGAVDDMAEPETDIEPDPEPVLEPESEFQLAPRAMSHTCTARSSLQCQQCMPSGRTSKPLSPFRSSPISPQQSPQESCRSTLPPEPIAEPMTPISVEPEPVEDEMSYSSLEGRFLRSNYVDDAISYVTQSPVADPVKKPSVSRLRLKSIQTPTIPPMPVKPSSPPQPKSPPRVPPSPAKEYISPAPPRPPPPAPLQPTSRSRPPPKPRPPPVAQSSAPHYHYYTCAPPKPLPQPPPVIIARPFPEVPSVATSLDACAKDRHDITDKLVFKGLHVATAAACDEAVDKWIEEITGHGVRKLLADLSRFEGLGTNTLADVAKRASRQRRDQIRDWELVRESRLQNDVTQQEVHFVEEGEKYGDFADEEEEGDYVEYGERSRSRKERSSDRDELLGDMAHKRDCKGVERARDRAVKMGWRERSVSGAP